MSLSTGIIFHSGTGECYPLVVFITFSPELWPYRQNCTEITLQNLYRSAPNQESVCLQTVKKYVKCLNWKSLTILRENPNYMNIPEPVNRPEKTNWTWQEEATDETATEQAGVPSGLLTFTDIHRSYQCFLIPFSCLYDSKMRKLSISSCIHVLPVLYINLH